MSLSHLFNETWLKSVWNSSILCSLKYRDVTKSAVLRKYTSELGRQGDRYEKKKKKSIVVEGRIYEFIGSLWNIKGTILLTTI